MVTVGGILGNTKTKVEANGFTTGFPGHPIMFTFGIPPRLAYDPISFWVRLRVYDPGWYNINDVAAGLQRIKLYPDESFIVANRTSSH